VPRGSGSGHAFDLAVAVQGANPLLQIAFGGHSGRGGAAGTGIAGHFKWCLAEKGKKTELLAIEDHKAESLDPDGIICPGPEQPEEPAPPKKSGGPKRQQLGDREAPPKRGPVPLPPGGGGEGGAPDPSGEPTVHGPDPIPLPGPTEDPDGIMAGPVVETEPPRKRQRIGGEFSPGLDGAMILFQDYPDPHDPSKRYLNYTLRCPRPECRNCTKVKGESVKNTKRLGVLEPLAFLHAWIAKDFAKEGKSHRNTDPAPQDVDAYFAHRQDDLQELYDRLRA